MKISVIALNTFKEAIRDKILSFENSKILDHVKCVIPEMEGG